LPVQQFSVNSPIPSWTENLKKSLYRLSVSHSQLVRNDFDALFSNGGFFMNRIVKMVVKMIGLTLPDYLGNCSNRRMSYRINKTVTDLTAGYKTLDHNGLLKVNE